MSNHIFLGRYSTRRLDFTVRDSVGVVGDADSDPTVSMRLDGAPVDVFERTATRVEEGLYRVEISSVETSEPGYYSLTWRYSVNSVEQMFVLPLEVSLHSADTYNRLSPETAAIVDGVWMRFEDLFDSAAGGPHLQMYQQSSFSRERVAQLLGPALTRLNTTSLPYGSFTIEANDFPFKTWGGLWEQALYVETIKHLMRSYNEQPSAQGVAKARLDRTRYTESWRAILREEEPILSKMLSTFSIASMNLGHVGLLVSGGVFGEHQRITSPGRPSQRLPIRIW